MQKRSPQDRKNQKNTDYHYYLGSTGASDSVREGSFSRVFGVLFVVSFISLVVFGVFGIIHIARTSYFTAVTTYEEYRKNELIATAQALTSSVGHLQEDLLHLFEQEDNLRLIHGLTPVDKDVRLAGVGGQPSLPYMAHQLLAAPELRKLGEVNESLDNMHRQLNFMDKTLSYAYERALIRESYFAERPSVWPASGRITSSYGSRFHPILGRQKAHHGLDIGNKEWTPITAPANGVCTFEGRRGDYGIMVILNHELSGYETRYAHLIGTAIERGQEVKRGDVIGYLGNTGRSTGAHLHYEVRKNQQTLNPKNFLPDSTIVVE